MAFKFGYIVTMERISGASIVGDVAQFSRLQQDLTCEIIAFKTYFSKCFMDGFQIWIWYMVSIARISQVSTFVDLGSMFKITAGGQ